MGVLKISEELHGEIRKSSAVMSRSINSQAEFWLKIGMLCERNPDLTFNQIILQQLRQEQIDPQTLISTGQDQDDSQ